MARLQIYILVTPSGPDRYTQEKIIRAAVEVDEQTQWYCDDLVARKRKRQKDDVLPFREQCISHLRQGVGDMMVVASPGMIGFGKEDVRKVLSKLNAKGSPLVLADIGKVFTLTDDMIAVLKMVEDAALEHKQRAASKARAARGKGPDAFVPQPKVLKMTDAEIRQIWMDTARWPSQKDVAEQAGCSVRTLYGRFGPRRPVIEVKPTRKRKAKADV